MLQSQNSHKNNVSAGKGFTQGSYDGSNSLLHRRTIHKDHMTGQMTGSSLHRPRIYGRSIWRGEKDGLTVSLVEGFAE